MSLEARCANEAKVCEARASELVRDPSPGAEPRECALMHGCAPALMERARHIIASENFTAATAIRGSLRSCRQRVVGQMGDAARSTGLVGVHAVRVSLPDALRRRRWLVFAVVPSAHVTEQHNVSRLGAGDSELAVK
jgi:hypothetical protein